MTATMKGTAKLEPGENIIIFVLPLEDETKYAFRTNLERVVQVLDLYKDRVVVRNTFDTRLNIKWKVVQKRSR